MKQIQTTINRILRFDANSVDKADKIQETHTYLLNQRRRFVAEAPIGFKPRTSSDFFLNN